MGRQFQWHNGLNAHSVAAYLTASILITFSTFHFNFAYFPANVAQCSLNRICVDQARLISLFQSH